VSLTRVPDGKNVIMSQFSSKEEVIQVRNFNLPAIQVDSFKIKQALIFDQQL